jgi:hypothetical protein
MRTRLQVSEAIQRATAQEWIASSLAPRNDGEARLEPLMRSQGHRAEGLKEMLVELAAHLFHGRKGLGVRER